MINQDSPAPLFPSDRANPYGSDQPAMAGAGLASKTFNPGGERIFSGLVTDCSTQTYSCTVTIPNRTARYGIPCLWGTGSINRWGGCSDFNPPQVGSVVAVYMMEGSNFGIVLAQLPGKLDKDPEYPGGGCLDPHQAVHAFMEDTGQVLEDLGIGGSGLNGYQKQPNDAFAGDRGFYNEYGLVMALTRTMAMMKGSELAKIEAFMLDDLVRITAKNFDAFLGSGDFQVRDDKGYLMTDWGFGPSHPESIGLVGGKQSEWPFWRLRGLIGHLADIRKDYVVIPVNGPDDPRGVSQSLDDSSGLRVVRSIAGGGFVKSKAIGVPRKIREADDPLGAEDPDPPQPDLEGLADFDWKFNEAGDITMQMRDALTWLLNRQQNAKHIPYETENPDWIVGDDSEAGLDPGNSGANTPQGGHYRENLDPIDVLEMDAGDLSKPRAVRINDAWVIVLPDGTVTIRDGHASCVTMTRGHITQSASKDVNIIAGRSVNIKAGDDINVNARKALDLTSGQGQVRVYARKSLFLHSEDEGIMLSTNSTGSKSKPEALGEEKAISGIILKPHADADVVVQSRSTYIQSRNQFFVGGWPLADSPFIDRPQIRFEGEEIYHKVDQASWQLGGVDYVRFGSGFYSVETSSSILTEGNVDAPLGTVRMNSSHDEHERNDFCISPAEGYSVIADRYEPLYSGLEVTGSRSTLRRNVARKKCGQDPDHSNVDTGTPYGWGQLHSSFDRREVVRLEFSLRTEKDYATKGEDFFWSEQPWMREWEGASAWGEDGFTVGASSGERTWIYPGRDYWEGSSGFKTYVEENVNPNGDPKKRDGLSNAGGSFNMAGWTSMGRHPDV